MDTPVCTGYDGNFSSAAQPSLTSLANGTLVMAFEEYNITTCSYTYCTRNVAPYFYPSYTTYDRIVVTESYDNGTTWTAPTTLDSVTNNSVGYYTVSNYPDLMPRVAAYGNTIYVAWQNVTYPYICGYLSGVTLRASTDGGATWNTATQIAAQSGTSYCNPTNSYNAANPDVLVAPNGTLYVSFITQLGYQCPYSCGSAASVVVGASTDNGSTFTYTTVAAGQYGDYQWYNDQSVFVQINPSLAYGATTGQLFVTWSALTFGNYCTEYNLGYTYCGYNYPLSLFIANSSDGGTTWNAHAINTTLQNPDYGWWNQVYMP
jgi:hypothetical protein